VLPTQIEKKRLSRSRLPPRVKNPVANHKYYLSNICDLLRVGTNQRHCAAGGEQWQQGRQQRRQQRSGTTIPLARQGLCDRRCCRHHHSLVVGGPAHSFPPFFFILARRYFFSGGESPKNRQTPNKERPSFDTTRIAPPHRRDFTIDLQQCWSINRKIGDRQCTYYLIVRALTVADCCFFGSCHHSAAITQLIVTFSS
jgi:hypothetical protein